MHPKGLKNNLCQPRQWFLPAVSGSNWVHPSDGNEDMKTFFLVYNFHSSGFSLDDRLKIQKELKYLEG